jgi:iron complex outermembrane receptor protein
MGHQVPPDVAARKHKETTSTEEREVHPTPRTAFALTPVAAAVWLALSAVAAPAFAQEAAPAPAATQNAGMDGDKERDREREKGRLQSIVVTANKRVEKLEHVPLAISVLTEEMIERNNVRDIEDVINLSPALSITYGTTPANNGINMRGIGTTSIGIGVEADVAVIFDDIPIGMQVKAFSDLLDVQRIEILKGPQSTLFGKSAIAGAIYITSKPIVGPLRGTATTLFTSDHETRYAVSYGGEVSDKFGFRIAASDNDFSGNVNNLATGEKVNGSKSKTFMAKLAWHPTASLDVEVSPRYDKTTTNCCVLVLTSFNPLAGALLSNVAQLPAASLLNGITPGPDNRDIRNDAFTGQESTDKGGGVKLTQYFANGAQLAYIASIDKYDAQDNRDQDFVDVPTLLYYPLANGQPARVNAGYIQYGTFNVHSKTQELRLVSPDAGPLRYVAGFWYAKNVIDRHFIRGYNGIALTTPVQYFTSTYNINKAVYGQATWDFARDFSVLGGLRFNHEESGYAFAVGAPPPGDFVPTATFGSKGNTENATTGKLSLQYQINPDVMVYTMGATGYKGLAYDLTSSLNAATAAQQPVPSETAKTYEVGLKGNFLGNRLTVNLSAFTTRFRNYQQNSGGYLPGTTTYVTRLNSVGGVQTKGVEIDLTALPIPALLLNLSAAYTDATITDFPNAPCYNVVGSANGGFNAQCRLRDPAYGNQNVQDISGGRMPNAPRVKVTFSGIYDIILPTVPVNGFVTGTVRYQSDVLTNLNQDPTLAASAYTIVNLGAGIRDKLDRYKLTFFVDNVFDKHYANTGFTGLGNWSARAPNPVVNVTTTTWTPARDAFRFFGVRVDLRF